MFLSSKTVVTGLRSAVPVLSRSISTAATFDYRRLREKQKWGSPEPEDPDYLVFPNEKLGRDYDLNWCINSYRVTPKTWAYRNLHLRGLQMLASGRLDPSKALIVDTNENANHQTYFVERGANAANPAPALPEGSDVLDRTTYQLVIREVRQYLSSIDELYVHDGAVGTNPGVSEVRSRIIADSAKSALFLRHILSPVPQPAEVSEYQHPLTVYVASDVEISNIGKLRSPSYSLIDLDNGTIVVNSPSPIAIRESLATAAAYLAYQQNALLLPCDSVVVGEAKPEIKLVFGNSAKNLSLHGAHHNIWSSSGLSRAWEGITYDSLPKGVSLQRGDLIEEVSKNNKSSGKRVTTSLKSTLGQRAPSPSGVFFLVNEKSVSGVASVSSNQATNLLKKVYKSTPTAVSVNDIATKFEQLLKESSVPTFVVNEEQAAKDGALLEKIKSVSQKGASVSAADSKLFS